ncbi:DUF5677 domain-containing protein [Clostridium perfringens]|nr:DUF5677 domain-containing protein [Clostridium perfringens]
MYNDEFLKDIMTRVENDFLINGRGYVITSGYEYFREVITLYAKQHNLLESTLLLLENNNVEEAYILARSLVNNYFLIGYLLNDNENRTRLKEYHNQPIISNMYQLKNMKEILLNNTFKNISEEDRQSSLSEIDEKIKIYKNLYKKNGIKKGEKPLKITTLAKNCDEQAFALYVSIYSDASKYEHSDITSLDLYKKEVTDEYSNNDAFILDMNSTNEDLKIKIFDTIEMVYCDTFSKIANIVFEKEKHLLENYDENKLLEIVFLITNRFNGKLKKIK